MTEQELAVVRQNIEAGNKLGKVLKAVLNKCKKEHPELKQPEGWYGKVGIIRLSLRSAYERKLKINFGIWKQKSTEDEKVYQICSDFIDMVEFEEAIERFNATFKIDTKKSSIQGCEDLVMTIEY